MADQKPQTCDICENPPTFHSDLGWLCHRCHKIWSVGEAWSEVKRRERKVASMAHDEIRRAHGEGYPETVIADLIGCDRGTVRRAIGKPRA